MAELATARALSFEMESMTIEDRVEALEQWGKVQFAAGRREERRRETDRFLDGAMGPAPEPGVEQCDSYGCGMGQGHAGLCSPTHAPELEQPSSLALFVAREGFTRRSVQRIAEAIDALAALHERDESKADEACGRLFSRLDALEALVGDVSVVERIGRAHRNDPDHDTGGPG